MKLTKRAEDLKERYLRFGITDIQLKKYKDLGVINKTEYDYIRSLKNSDSIE